MSYELTKILQTRPGPSRRTREATKPRSRIASSPGLRNAVSLSFGLVFLINVAVILWLWLQSGGVSGAHSLGNLLTSVGRISGLLGGFLLLIQVLLLVRFPPLERLVGFDRLTRWHGLNGKLCLYLILAHVIFITLGYAMLDRLAVPGETATLLTQYPGMVQALIGTVFLILVAVSSVVIVRRRLRYESWFLVHLLAYAGIVLAWFHQIPTGNEFVLNRKAATYWTALYAGTLALLVLFRFVRPLLRSLRFRMRVAEVIDEGPNVISLRITGRHLDKLDARAGQFFLWRFLTSNCWWESHPFSLSAAPDGKSLRITVKGVGDFTSRIGQIRPGTPVLAEGPFGVFTDEQRQREEVALIAGGIGITPIRALLEELQGDLVLIYRANTEEELIFRDELEALGRRRGVILHCIVGDYRDPACRDYLSPEHMRHLVPDIASREVYLCGPPAMMPVVEKNLRQVGVPPRHIHSEKFAL